MTLLVQLALAIFSLCHLVSTRPDSWQAHLWRGLEPKTQVATITPTAQPIKNGSGELTLGASEYLAVDRASGTTLLSHNPDAMRPIASVTKLATILVILRDHTLDETVVIPKIPTNYPEGAVTLDIKPGQKFKLEDLVKAALVPSANNVADALAIWDAGSIKAFASKASDLLSQWGIADINIADANGLNPNSKASARALEKLGELVLTNPQIDAIVKTSHTSIKDSAGKTYSFKSTNELLGDKRFEGIKTGYTADSGQNLVAMARVKGHDVVSVVLNSPDRFGETLKLINFVQTNWSWQ